MSTASPTTSTITAGMPTKIEHRFDDRQAQRPQGVEGTQGVTGCHVSEARDLLDRTSTVAGGADHRSRASRDRLAYSAWTIAPGARQTLDADDPLAAFRDRFVIADADLVYLDGNSLGRLPQATRDRLRDGDRRGSGATELIRGWDRWIDLAREAGDVIAAGVLEARPGR